MGRNSSESPVRNSHKSPLRRERSAGRERPSRHPKPPPTHSPLREKPSRSSKQTRSRSRSPSPRSKRLRRDGSNNNKDDKSSERGHGKTRSPSPRTRRLKRAQADEINDTGGNNSRGDHRNGNDDDSVAQMKAAEEALATKEKQKPSFELSGKLAAETNRVKGVTLLFTEPPDARKPEIRWRLYVFKGGEALNEPLYVHRQTCYLFGRERRVADIPTDHPSCSKQHAVLQYRQVEVEQPDGMLAKKIRPYIMDLGSTNGTFLNGNCIEAERYYEVMEKDTIKFGNSSREYVLLHENSA